MKIIKQHRNILVGSILFLFTGLFSGCVTEKIEPVDPNDLPDVMSFSEHIAPIFSNKCSQCHFGKTPPDLSASEAYLNLSSGGFLNAENPEKSGIYTVITTGNMTQYASEADRAYILKWLQQGALDN